MYQTALRECEEEAFLAHSPANKYCEISNKLSLTLKCIIIALWLEIMAFKWPLVIRRLIAHRHGTKIIVRASSWARDRGSGQNNRELTRIIAL